MQGRRLSCLGKAKPDEIVTGNKALPTPSRLTGRSSVCRCSIGASLVGELLDDRRKPRTLTARETRVLAAMADGGGGGGGRRFQQSDRTSGWISFHTAKFHVAAIPSLSSMRTVGLNRC